MQRGEITRLRGMSHLAVALYAIALRPRAADGIIRGTSWAELARDVAIAPQPGAPGESVDVSRVRRAVGALVRVGLVEAMPSAGAGLDFALPLLEHSRADRPTGETLQADRAKPSAGLALRAEADRAEPARPTGERAPAAQADRAQPSSGAALRVEADSGASRSASGNGAPSLPPSHSPPITPSLLSPHHSPTLDTRANVASEGNGMPVFTLTAPPAHDAPELERSEPAKATKTRVPEPFIPTLGTLKALEQKGLPSARSLAEVGHFVTWWKDAPANFAPTKRATGWQLAFVNWCLKLLPRQGAENAQQPRKLSASERNAASIRRSRGH